MSKKVRHSEVICVQCKCNTPDKNNCRFTCCLCKTGPLCEACIGNDIEHERCDYPLCVLCVNKPYWCACCEMIISFPGKPKPTACKRCKKLICKSCKEDHKEDCRSSIF